MTNELFEAVQQWQQDGCRSVDIEIGKGGSKNSESIWCFDYSLMEGSHINSVKELESLDLVSKKRDRLLKELENL